MELERRGVPVVMVVTEAFVSLARSVARSRGCADLPMVVLPHPFETLARETVERFAHERFPEIIAKLVHSGAEQRAAAR